MSTEHYRQDVLVSIINFTIGITERFNQTVLDEFYCVYFRKKGYTALDEIQVDLDAFLETYNSKRTNQVKNCKGRTPLETFTEGLNLCRHNICMMDMK